MKRRPAASRTVDFRLTGKLFCGHCQGAMVGVSGTSKTETIHYYYACSRQRKHKCNKRPVTKDWIEQMVVQMTVKWVLKDEVINRMAEAVVDLQERERDDYLIQGMQQQLKKVNNSIENVMDAIEQGIITPTTKNRLQQLEQEKHELETGIQSELVQRPDLSKEQIVYWIEQFKGGDVTDTQYQQSIIDTFIQAIYLYDDRIKIVFNYSKADNQIEYSLVDNIDKSEESALRGKFDFDCLCSTKTR